ncbi:MULTISPECIES: succinate--CoA ligase subunit alpha [unclassified Clostridium]|mgnify:CR=1 FL=1|jgi:succinyl-CoA synthetase alpha subunit|uniref:succinate--CoA ligase subunit alpha n=1 Tax=unclassified Clostridium TaxID=2614128 RepID=UPI001105A1B9|nr:MULTISPECIES: succinate--CoA ligase subunit alpha [unclassified Clostridium]
MSIYIGKDTKVIVQGITGFHGKKHTQLMREFGTNIVAGVTPGKLGQNLDGIPVFDTVAQAVEATGANASVIFVPPAFAADSIMEAVNAGLDICVCITENIPVQDMIKVKNYMKGKKTRLIGPNCPGLVTPGECKMGITPGYVVKPGKIGVVSRSGSLTYETIKQLSEAGLGQSTCVGIGGDPIKGTSFLDVIQAFHEDGGTEAVVMIGEIGGNSEQEAAMWIKEHMNKPVVAFIGGQTAPPGKRMGHAGAVISGGKGTAAEKIRVLNECGIPTARMSDLIGETLIELLKERGIYERCLSC